MKHQIKLLQFSPSWLHFVDNDCDICEEFIEFIKLEQVPAGDITESIAHSIGFLELMLYVRFI